VHTAIREREREGVKDRQRQIERERETKIPHVFVGRGGQSYVIETKTLGEDFIRSTQLSASWNVGRETSGFCREVDEISALLGCYAVVIPYRCFGTNYRPKFKGSRIQEERINGKQTVLV
jgi:hypothetical protein